LGRKTVYEYDNLYRNTAEKWYDGSTLVRTLGFTFDAASRLTQATDLAGTYGFTYDALNRVKKESQSFAGFSHLIEYSRAFNKLGSVTTLSAVVGGKDKRGQA
jgi:YD repeat-containing protein